VSDRLAFQPGRDPLLHVSVPSGRARRIDGGTLSEPNEATTAEPVATETTAPDTTPEESGKAQNAETPRWKRWLGKS
jgi:hypothetical protein